MAMRARHLCWFLLASSVAAQDEMVERANTAFREERLAEAAALYEQALARTEKPLTDANRQVVQLNLAHTRFRLEQWQPAIEAYRDSGSQERLRWIAQCYLQLGENQTAAHALASHLVLFPGDSSARGQLAQLYAMLGDTTAALIAFRSLLEERPDDPALHLNVARALLDQGGTTEAMDELEIAWRLGQRDAATARLLGDLYLQQDMHVEAADWYARFAVATDEKSAEDEFRAGFAYYQGGEYVSAERCFQRAVALDESYAKGFLYLAMVETETGEADAARAYYERALACDGELVDAHEGLGNVHLECGRFAESAAAFERAIELGAVRLAAHYNLVVARIRGGQRDLAVEALKEALHAHPTSTELRGLMKMLKRAK